MMFKHVSGRSFHAWMSFLSRSSFSLSSLWPYGRITVFQWNPKISHAFQQVVIRLFVQAVNRAPEFSQVLVMPAGWLWNRNLHLFILKHGIVLLQQPEDAAMVFCDLLLNMIIIEVLSVVGMIYWAFERLGCHCVLAGSLRCGMDHWSASDFHEVPDVNRFLNLFNSSWSGSWARSVVACYRSRTQTILMTYANIFHDTVIWCHVIGKLFFHPSGIAMITSYRLARLPHIHAYCLLG